jgi:hypothetical protein
MYKTDTKTLVHIYNFLLSSVIFPDRLKADKVIPLYTKGDIHDVKKLQTYSHFIVIFQNTAEINV